ncbi:MAG TPA: lipoate--protein ligase family protein [Massilibacterium sp.]|nr:lipoate--protein ligase family protein [Massilibacterium sp.]
MKNLFSHRTFRFIDQSLPSMIDQFAIDDTLTALVGQKKTIETIRYWVVPQTIALGIQDQKLPFLQEGLLFLKKEGYTPVFRPSGGLGVVLDEGIINLSLHLPEKDHSLSIDRGFLAMVTLVKEWLFPYINPIDVKEIKESYCPGKYDLSVDGKKFAGLSQRRIKGGVGIFIYIAVHGSGKKRAELMKKFYEISIKNEQTPIIYPSIQPDVMASVSELSNQSLTCEQLKKDLLTLFVRNDNTLDTRFLQTDEWAVFQFYKKRMEERQKI